jgi:hypothetical protein
MDATGKKTGLDFRNGHDNWNKVRPTDTKNGLLPSSDAKSVTLSSDAKAVLLENMESVQGVQEIVAGKKTDQQQLFNIVVNRLENNDEWKDLWR